MTKKIGYGKEISVEKIRAYNTEKSKQPGKYSNSKRNRGKAKSGSVGGPRSPMEFVLG